MELDIGPAIYAPWSRGVYEVAPNLKPFGADFGNGKQDQKLFQFDSEYPRYLRSKVDSYQESPIKYIARHGLESVTEEYLLNFISRRLLEESPDLVGGAGAGVSILGSSSLNDLDRLVLALQEDVAVVTKREGRDWISYINVCNPSHWLPTEKIGLSFFDSHVPVPGFERVNAAAEAMVDTMINRGPFVRFVWGLESDDRLNHHPVAPPGWDQTEWYGRQFARGLFVRVERQILWPLPEIASALFTIRPIVYTVDSVKHRPDRWSKLVEAYRSMNEATRAYKGLPSGLL